MIQTDHERKNEKSAEAHFTEGNGKRKITMETWLMILI
jgi:hypothetical protein